MWRVSACAVLTMSARWCDACVSDYDECLVGNFDCQHCGLCFLRVLCWRWVLDDVTRVFQIMTSVWWGTLAVSTAVSTLWAVLSARATRGTDCRRTGNLVMVRCLSSVLSALVLVRSMCSLDITCDIGISQFCQVPVHVACLWVPELLNYSQVCQFLC